MRGLFESNENAPVYTQNAAHTRGASRPRTLFTRTHTSAPSFARNPSCARKGDTQILDNYYFPIAAQTPQ